MADETPLGEEPGEEAPKAKKAAAAAAEDAPAWEGSLSATEPIVAPDGHVVLSQEDIDARAE